MLRKLVMASLLALLASGCGGGGSDNAGSGASLPTPTPTPTPTPDPDPDPAPEEPDPEEPEPEEPPPEEPDPEEPVPTPPPDPGSSAEEQAAARFLNQASFGATPAGIAALASNLDFEGWLNQQRNLTPSLVLPFMRSPGQQIAHHVRIDGWFNNAVRGNDQLRQRMAFALSEIMVTSDLGGITQHMALAMGAYNDILVNNALGNFRTLLEEVTLSQAMGRYLSMFGNQKADPARGIRADENFARELMQLFTVGLAELNLDGTVRTDASGDPIPTYGQSDIVNLARVFTGWSYPGGTTTQDFIDYPSSDPAAPMDPYETFHDDEAKVIIGNTALPAGQTARQDLEDALDTLFNHPNVGPFIGKQLIQRLVTSNPSPAYVRRVAQVFNNNGSGVRGDLFAVAKAILLDEEARNGHTTDPENFGKLREPIIRLVHLWRVFEARDGRNRYGYRFPEEEFGQAPLRSPSVFNFFRPTFSPVGALRNAGLLAPEFQITNETTIVTLANRFQVFTNYYRDSEGRRVTEIGNETVYLNYIPWESLARDAAALIEELDLTFMSGQMPANMRATLVSHVSSIPASNTTRRLQDAAHLVITSPQYAIQR